MLVNLTSLSTPPSDKEKNSSDNSNTKKETTRNNLQQQHCNTFEAQLIIDDMIKPIMTRRSIKNHKGEVREHYQM